MWNYTTGNGLFKAVYSSSAIVDSVVYVGSNDGFFYALYTFPGAQLWNYTTGMGVKSFLTVAGGYVYVGSMDDNFNCLGASKGSITWQYDVGDRDTSSSPTIANWMIYIGSGDLYDGNVFTLRLSLKYWNTFIFKVNDNCNCNCGCGCRDFGGYLCCVQNKTRSKIFSAFFMVFTNLIQTKSEAKIVQ